MNDEHVSESSISQPDAGSSLDDFFGFCPRCFEVGDYASEYTYRSVVKADYLCCEKHECYWYVGGPFYMDPRGESVEVWKSNAEVLETLTEVEPRHLPETERRWAARGHREKLIAELGTKLSDEQQEAVIRQLCELTDSVVEGGRLLRREDDDLPF